MMEKLLQYRQSIRNLCLASEHDVIKGLIRGSEITPSKRDRIGTRAVQFVHDIRAAKKRSLMEAFLAEYGLSSTEGVALMCLAEALLRVPDMETIDALIEDKITPSSWGQHLGQSSSSLVNASTWGLLLSGKVLQDGGGKGISEVLHGLLKRLGEPVIRAAIQRAMKEMGHQFVLGRTIEEACQRGKMLVDAGYRYSYDMLGEAALTAKDADAFTSAYRRAISVLAKNVESADIRDNAGISIKLSALHPRYESSQKARVMKELVPRVLSLAMLAKEANMGLNIDAEEAARLDLSLDVIAAVFASPQLAGWDGFGVVVQAYSKCAAPVLDWLYCLSERLDRKIMVRLVKGAYWDTEIKLAQVLGIQDFPVFTQKSATDISYICCAEKLLTMTDRIYPQFATHNAHTVAAVLELAQQGQAIELQRLHGMGDALYDTLYDTLRSAVDVRCRIYAPVGAHRDLLAYLVRRLLENGANSSFVHQIVDVDVAPETVTADPFTLWAASGVSSVVQPMEIFQPERANSVGWDLDNPDDLMRFHAARNAFADLQLNLCSNSTDGDVTKAIDLAENWANCSAKQRGEILSKAADLYEENAGEAFALLSKEAGKTALDAISEIREAVDFLRFYVLKGVENTAPPRGVITCISPWNFPLAIFTGQIAAALAAGNGVLAKPAESTPLIAQFAVGLLHQAGVPKAVLQLLIGQGVTVGARLTADPRIAGVCFTGSTQTARHIHQSIAQNLAPEALFIAETGGLNAMVVDSSALPEQAVQDILVSAFQSAGQRCSALRVLYVQEEISAHFLMMLYGAMDELRIGDSWLVSTDVGPVINLAAQESINSYVEAADAEGRLLKRLLPPSEGFFVAPAVIAINGIEDLEREIFGPVLHVATFRANELHQIVENINNSGYGLTFGLHTRIDDRVEKLTTSLNVGNMYINRNQIGAVVGSQPFGGEGLSGTGPKAGGGQYVHRFGQPDTVTRTAVDVNRHCANKLSIDAVQAALDGLDRCRKSPLSTVDLAGPTGESNRLSIVPRGVVLCLGVRAEDAMKQAQIAEAQGCSALIVAPDAEGANALNGWLDRADLSALTGFDVVALWSDAVDHRAAKIALANRVGVIIPLVTTADLATYCIHERHVCIDTTAAGGNVALLSG